MTYLMNGVMSGVLRPGQQYASATGDQGVSYGRVRQAGVDTNAWCDFVSGRYRCFL